MEDKSYSLGIDLGTSGVKITAVDVEGKIIKKVKEPYEIERTRNGWAEQSPETWWSCTKQALKKIIKSLNSSLQIETIGVTGQMHGLVVVDERGEPLYPAMIWADNRVSEEVAWLEAELTDTQRKRLANPLVTSFTAPKILWLKQHEPDLWQQVDKILLPKDYIVYRLSGEIASDKSDASATLLFDVKNGSWDREIITKLNISFDLFPPLVEPGDQAGKLKSELAAEYNLNRGEVVVVAAGGDAPVSALASGAYKAGQGCISLGTAGQIIFVSREFLSESEQRLHTLYYSRSGYRYLMGAVLAAGHNLSWFLREILEIEAKEEVFLSRREEEVRQLPAGSNGLIYLPYIQGERSPLNDPRAAGCFFGLRSEHSQLHFLRSMMEGVGFALKSNFVLMQELGCNFQEIFLTGGGAQSRLWSQICADILGYPVKRSRQNYGAGYGAALLAARAAGIIENVAIILQENRKDYELIKPDRKAGKSYDEIFSLFRDLYLDNKNKMHVLNNLY